MSARRLLAHEARALHSLGLWLRRRRHQVPPDAVAVAYTGPQTAMLYGLLFVSVVETVMFALLIPWPVAHGVMLVLDLYGVLFALSLHAACVSRPHVVHADGSLRVRYGALLDLTLPASAIASARVERRCPDGRPIRVLPDGVLEVAVGSQTTVAVELTGPVEFERPLGGRGSARTVRFHADDPAAAVRALRRTLRPAVPEAGAAAAPEPPGHRAPSSLAPLTREGAQPSPSPDRRPG